MIIVKNLFYKVCRKFIFWRSNIIKKFNKNYYTWLAKQTVSSFQEPLKINNKTILSKNTYLGSNTNFNGLEITGIAKVEIGNNFHSGVQCKIITSFHNFEGTRIPYDHTLVNKNVKIGDNVWLGDQVIVLGGVTIGEGAIIQAGSVVVSNIPEYGIAGGHPAKVFKYRNIENYHSLKSSEQFY